MLVVAGAAVAGSSAAWLVGSPAEAVELPPLLPLPAVEDVVGGQHRLIPAVADGPSDFGLPELDPAALVARSGLVDGSALVDGSGARELLVPAAEPVAQALHETAVEPVQRVADSAVTASGQRAEQVSHTVGRELAELSRPLLLRGEFPAQHDQSPVRAPQLPPATGPALQPAAPSPATVDNPGAAERVARPSSESQGGKPASADGDSETPRSRQIPVQPRPFTIPVSAPGSTGSGTAADGHHNGVGIGWHPSGPSGAAAFIRVPARGAAPALTGRPVPQPGITPD
ncbi:hypothetical protein SACE_7363 [Saccharopolyspora erythraea NRRL 2338]|uniref:Uncharacterized protein n=1 Tax=Saccharopolyspora erythraea (strain ATCC 11635 / DSM 40517 / JCM 4748 / NBRC 13426 / NCIMB 8594 / NRRL 2338) TaxID=405948 RepID=A4FR44_SACEN|nr:hypothetical protein SACE_7363 [Saccharopolyspora erythraea NRRL 2338]